MKQHTKWFAGAFAAASVLLMAGATQAQVVLSDFDNFNLTVTYANWNPDGSQPINGGSGYTPTLTSGPTSYSVNAQGYGSGGYSIPLGSQQLLSTDIAQATLSLTLNNISHTDAWMGIKFLLSDNQGNNDVFYGTYVGVFGVDNGGWANGSVGTASWSGETLTMTVPLTGAMLTGIKPALLRSPASACCLILPFMHPVLFRRMTLPTTASPCRRSQSPPRSLFLDWPRRAS